MLNKVYAVIEFGGEYEDVWQHLVGVCESRESALKLKEKVEKSHDIECSISRDTYCNMLNELYDYEEEHGEIFDNIVEGLHKLFPDYIVEEIEKAEEKYDGYDDFLGAYIEETDFYHD